MLRFDDVYIGFGPDKERDSLVRALSFEVAAGEVLAIVGESGSGKSLSVLSMNDLVPGAFINAGHAWFETREGKQINLFQLDDAQRKHLLNRDFGYIFQEPMTSLNPLMPCGLQVEEMLRSHKNLSAADRKQEVITWFRKVQLPKPESCYHTYPHELSGGQRQRVMIAMALIHQPRLIVADEPTTALDASVQGEITEILLHLVKDSGCAMLFISHDLHVVRSVADKVVVMYGGRCMESGSVKSVFEHPESAYTKALLHVKPGWSQRGLRLPTLSDMTVYRNGRFESVDFVQEIIPDAALGEHEVTEPILRIEDVSLSFNDQQILQHISLELNPGESLGVIGESGSGKSTLIKTTIGLLNSSGNISFEGVSIQEYGKQYPLKVQMIFQDPYASLNPNMSIGSAIAEPLKVHGLRKGKAAIEARVIELLLACGLNSNDMSKYPHQFSGGQRQRICIARALALEPKVLLCDEIVSALDVSVQAQILNLLKDLQIQHGLSIIFITHDLNVAAWFCDRLAVLYQGRLVESGSCDEVLHRPVHEYTQKLLRASALHP